MKQRQGMINFICAVMAMMVWVSGVYFQMQEVDSLFLCKPDGYSTASILRVDIPSEEAYLSATQELTLVREALVRTATERIIQFVRGERLTVNVLLMQILSALFSAYLIAAFVVGGKTYISNAVILQFIHSQDGEK